MKSQFDQLQTKAAEWKVTLEKTRETHTRALNWSFAQSVLSAIWDIEDGYQIKPDNPSLLLAQALRSQKDTKNTK